MTSFLKLIINPPNMREEILVKSQEAEKNRIKEYEAAVKIQSWVRGLHSRRHLRDLHQCSIKIQKHWRGYLARSYLRKYLNSVEEMMLFGFYNAMATRIQRIWRGFYIRKYKHDFYSRKKYYEALEVQNQIVKFEIDEWCNQCDFNNEKQRVSSEEKDMLIKARSQHYLLSTHQIRGIYNSPFLKKPSQMEILLRKAKPKLSEISKERKKRDKWQGCVDPDCNTDKILQIPQCLPPLDERKIQGPFKDRYQVYQQRHKPLNPSLRVQTDFNSLQRERNLMIRENDSKLLSDKKWDNSLDRSLKYERRILSLTQFDDKLMKTSYRDENKSKWITKDLFKTTVPPIPVFRNLNKTYYQGQVKID